MKNPKVNVPLLRKVYEWVSEQAALPAMEREWYQGSWAISPEMRLRTLFGQEADYTEKGALSFENAYHVWAANVDEQYKCKSAYCFAGYTCLINDLIEPLVGFKSTSATSDGRSIEDAAVDLLGLTDGEALRLFHGCNSFEKITEVVEEIMERAGEKL